MRKFNLLYLLIMLPFLFFYTGCSKDDNPVDNTKVNESETVAKYLETNGDFINTQAPALISAADVYANTLISGYKQYIIDIRSAADFSGKGHIEGAVNVAFKDLAEHYKTNNLAGYDKVIIACYSGQTAGYATSLLRMLGYNNVYDLKFGMSSWNKEIATNWTDAIKNGNAFASQFVSAATEKNAKGSLPELSTGNTDAAAILEARVNQLLTDGFGASTITNATVFANPSNYYIVNYWPEAHYSAGHIPGAVQYTPKADLKLDTYLTTLPTNKPVVVYCYSGQTSAHVAAYLKVLGYDAKTLLYGVNAMNYDNLPAGKFVPESEVHDYPYVK